MHADTSDLFAARLLPEKGVSNPQHTRAHIRSRWPSVSAQTAACVW